MSTAVERKQRKLQEKKQRREIKKAKKNARILCRNGSQYWTTQKQFWQWVRESKINKVDDGPLTGHFINEDEEKLIILANTVLNIACPNHLREAMAQRKFGLSR